MTAKRRRHKFDKKRKSDEHPHPRRSEEADRGSEGSRSRTGLIPRKRKEDAPDESPEGLIDAILKAHDRYRIKSVSFVPEGQGFPGSSFTIEDTEGLTPLNVIDPRDYHGFRGYPEGAKLYLTDAEKELLDEDQRRWEERLSGGEEAVRTAGSSDDKASS